MTNPGTSTSDGVAISGTDPTALASYDAALDDLLHFRATVTDVNEAALAADPDLVLARALQGYLGLLGTESDDAANADLVFNDWLATQDGRSFTPVERGHVAALGAWVKGDMRAAGKVLREVSIVEPRDALALAVGHQIDFLSGDAANLRDRVGGALTAWVPEDPHRSLLLGMYAFGLEECGDYGLAREVGSFAVEADPRDVWGIHAVTHTFEMQAEFGAGTRFLVQRQSDWADANFLSVHNWWHRCLYLLESGQTDAALAIYDAWIHNASSGVVVMELLDAAALLWRLNLEGDDQTERWSALADVWAGRSDTAYYSFNDMHAVMSYVGAGRIAEAERLVALRERWLADGPSESITNVAMTRDVGLPICRAILDFGRARYDDVVAALLPLRYRFNEFGGSHAQRDAVQRTLLEATLRSGRHDLARTLLSERSNLRPGSPYNWLKRAELAESLGRAAAAATDRLRAQELAAAGR